MEASEVNPERISASGAAIGLILGVLELDLSLYFRNMLLLSIPRIDFRKIVAEISHVDPV